MKILFIILCTTIFALPNAFAEVAGIVLLSKGSAHATNSKGVERPLKRRSQILEGDILTTAANSKLQIRFIDKALLTLKANSKLDINAYQLANEGNKSETVVMNLITGGFRTITGSIGKGEKSAYTVNTPAASIGVRGTNYEVAQEASGEFVVAVWEGGITLTNDQGSMDLGSNSDFDFARVATDKEPQGLDEQPAALTDTSPPPAGNSTEPESGDSEESNDEATSENNNEENESDEEATIANATDDTQETVDAAAASEGTAQESQLTEEMEKAEETATRLAEEPFPELITVPSADVRFNDTEYTYLLNRPRAGLLVNRGEPSNIAIENVLMVQNDSDEGQANSQIVSQPGGNVGSDLNLDSFKLDVSIDKNVEYQAAVEKSQYVSWGRWDGSVDISSDPNDPAALTTVQKDFYWLSAEAANLSSLKGEVSFSGSEGIGDINGTAIDSIDAKFDVNFANGAIENGSLNLSIAGEQTWDVNFDGSVTGVNATMNIVDSDINGGCSNNCVTGDIQGVFARPGNHFVGGFALGSNESDDKANGLFSLKQMTP